jgi:hypothetical protein
MEYLKSLTNMMQEIVRSTPPSWKEGVVIIRRNGQNFECEVTNPNTSEHLEISDKVRSLCREYACFKSSPDWKSDWSEAIFPYILGEQPGDFSSTDGDYKFPEEEN